MTKLATGGMAELYLARERGLAGLERLVVIKRILPHLADDPSFVDMFLREARIVARLNHPNVVQIFELGEEEGNYYIAMEYIHGSTVRELQVLSEDDQQGLPLEVITSVIEQACRGLHAAHELRDLEGNPLELIHRDVSPHNLMCTTEGYVKVLDFGVAKAAQGVEATNSGQLKGKFAYMSPEQCLGEKLDRRADVFSLGVVLWEALTDRRLFKRKKDLDMMRAVVNEDPHPPSRHNDQIPPAVDEVVLRALRKDRDERFQTADQMRQALIDAARSANIHYGEDRVATFLQEVAGEELAERQATMHDAMERSLTAHERKNLLHVTGSSSRSRTGGAEGTEQIDQMNTVVERPGDGSSNSVPRSSSSSSPSAPSRGSQPGAKRPTERRSEGSGSASTPGSERRTRRNEGSNSQSVPSQSVPSQSVPSPSDSGAHSSGRVARPLDEEARQSQAGDDTDKRSEARKGRRFLFAGLVLVVLGVGLGAIFFSDIRQSPLAQRLLGGGNNSPILIGEEVKIGWAPIATKDVLEEELEPFEEYLRSELGRPVDIEVTDDYIDVADGLEEGRYQVGVLPPLMYVLTTKEQPDLELLSIREFDGATSSDALLLTMMDSDVRTFEDLEGRTFCFTDRNSTTGNFLPRDYIHKQGHDPGEFIGEVVWSGDHLQGLRDLLEEKCDVAATYSGSFLTAENFDIPTGRIRQLAITGHVPQDAIVVPEETTDSVKRRLEKALFDFDPEEDLGVSALGEVLQITGFSKGSDRSFDDLRDAVENRKRLPERLKPDEDELEDGEKLPLDEGKEE
ncbi:MAG: serine/threonine-protein kinase [Persicimonas sp.]